MSSQLVVIDPRVANYQSLIEQLGASYNYLLLSADSDGVTQIANYVAANPGFDTIHLISHGSPGQVAVGTSTLSEATIGGYTVELNRIGASLNAGGDLLIYGCDVAQGVSGHQLITDLSRLTRLDVAASNNKTGSAGDWVLEAATGPIANALPAIQFFGDLATSPTIGWTRLVGSTGDERGSALTTGLDGAVYVTGYTDSSALDGQTNAGGQDAFVTKFAPDGTKVWTKLIGSSATDYCFALTAGLDGSIYAGGYTNGSSLGGQNNAGGFDAFVTKFAPDGTKVWTKLIGSTDFDAGQALTTGLDGSVYLAGTTYSSLLEGQTNAGNGDAFITKIAPDGTKAWTRLIGSTGSDQGAALATGLDGSVYVAGTTFSSALDGQTNAGSYDAFITKFAPNGTKAWTKLIGSAGDEFGFALTTGLDGSVYVAGRAFNQLNGQSNAGGGDAFITKISPDGNEAWTRLIGSPDSESGQALTTGLDGSVYVAGYAGGQSLDGQTKPGGSDAFVTKFAPDGTKVWTKLIGTRDYEGGQALTTSPDGSIYLAGDAVYLPLNGQTNAGGYDAFVIKLLDDEIPPTISITSNKTILKAGQTATLTFTLSESTTDFDSSDLTVAGGTITSFSGSGTSYSATFTPAANSTTNGVVSVASNKFSDAAGNLNVDGADANNSVTMAVDTISPTILITSDKSAVGAGQTALITFTLSEVATDFIASDVTVTGGTLSSLTGSGTAYTATFTPTANSTTNGVVSVASSKFSDPAGNLNADGAEANNTFTMTVDTVPISWTRLIGSTGFDTGYALTTGLDGSIYVAGTTFGSTLDGQSNAGSNDAFVTKFAPDGTKAWTKLIGSTNIDSGYALTTGLDGSIYVAGYTSSSALDGQTNAGSYDAFITKFAPDGTKAWTKLIGSTGYEDGSALTTGLDGSIYVAGNTFSTSLDGQTTAGTNDAFITKFAPDGTKAWTKLIGSTGVESGYDLTTGQDGSIYVAGNTSSTSLDGQSSGGGDYDAFITKFAPDGTKAWTKLIGSTGVESGYDLTTGQDGSVYLAGWTSSPTLEGLTNAGSYDAFITKFAPDGTKVWTRLIGSTDLESGGGLTAGLDGSVYLAGETRSTSLEGQTIAGSGGAFVTQFSPDGTKAWTKLIGSTGGGQALTTGLDGSIYVAGTTFGSTLDGQTNAGNSDTFLIKLLVDSITPTIAITSNKTGLAAGQTATLTFTLSEAASDFLVGDITASGGTISNFAGSGTTYTATFTPNTTSISNGVVSVASNKFSDAAGNLNLDGADANNSVTIAVDSVIPTIVVTTNKSSLSVGQTATINFVISESVSDFATGDVTVSGGTLSNFTGNGTAYSATFTPTTNSTANGVVSVGSNTFSDAAGNFNADGSDANNTVSITVNTVPADTTPPAIAISSNRTTLGLGQAATLTFTLSEPATDFDAGDLAVSGGTLSNFTGSGTSYSSTFTPAVNSTTSGVVSVASNKFSDAAGNFNADGSDADNTVSIAVDTRVVDTIPPTISISSDKSTLLRGQKASISFTLSEPSTNFGAGDVEVSGGSLSSFTGSDTSYSAIFTPVTNSREIASIYVGSKTFSDAAGNANVDGGDDNNTALLTIDTMVNRAPSASGGTVSGLQDAMVAISAAAIGFRDPDKGDVLRSITVTSLPGKGSLLVGGSAVSVGQVVSADDISGGSLSFKGAAMQSGAGYASFGFKVSDGRTLSAAESKITLNLKAVNHPPVVANPIADQETSEGQAFTLKLPSNTFTDLESRVLSYSAALNSGKPLPKWLKFDAKTATLSGTPGELDTGVLGISVKATDTGKASVTGAFDLTVLNINLAPVAKAIMATPTAIEGRAFAFSFPRSSFVDPDRGDVLTYSLSNAPAWLTIDSETGKLGGTLNYAAADTPNVTVTIKATDKQGLSASTPLKIKLVNVSKIVGTADNNTLMAGEGADNIMGLAGNDELDGGPGNDTLVGGLGDDRLTGGAGQDRFAFERAIKEGGNVDTVTDFASGSDTIALTGSLFAALSGDSDLSDNLWLTTSSSPATARSNLVFDPQSGALSYDPDGSGPAASIEICTLVGVTKLLPSDLVMV